MTRRMLAAAACAVTLAGCAAKRVTLPSGEGSPFPQFAAAYAAAAAECSQVTTVTAALGLSGKVGRTKLRGRVDAGFAAPAAVRLEGVAPFGKPVFVLVAHGNDATLVLPRDGRVLRGAPPAAIVEALAGVPLGAADLRAAVAGCGLPAAAPSDGRSYPDGWTAIVSGDTTTYLRHIDGRWRIVAATRGAMTIDYANFEAGRATTVHVRMMPGAATIGADITLKLSQLEINTPLERAVFDYDVPAEWAPLTLDELRRAGPLGEGGGR